MSEFQHIAFRAVDGPVSEENLEYMRRQSSRAEVTPWSFDNEYQYGDFRGNAIEMLRRGYDLHLHYANFGVRKLLIRLPHGLPDSKAAEPYLGKHAVQFLQDKDGAGGILSIDPYHEAGDLDELGDLGEFLDRLVPLRAEILNGDLRPLYLAHLAMACDDNHDPETTKEAPVPAGLEKPSGAQRTLVEFYGLSDALIAAAAQGCPAMPAHDDPQSQYTLWLRGRPQKAKDAWLARLMTDPGSSARSEILADFRKSRDAAPWPALGLDRTIAELEATAERIHDAAKRQAAAAAAAQKAKRLAGMAADPTPTLLETERLVALRSSESYRKIAMLLAELREALAGCEQSGLADQQARKLKTNNPTLHTLTSALRRQGFVPK
jgi:hypothetical protein